MELGFDIVEYIIKRFCCWGDAWIELRKNCLATAVATRVSVVSESFHKTTKSGIVVMSRAAPPSCSLVIILDQKKHSNYIILCVISLVKIYF